MAIKASAKRRSQLRQEVLISTESMLTLKRSFKGTSGPETELFNAGLDSKRTACASKGDAVKNATVPATSTNTTRVQRPGDMMILSRLRRISEKLEPDRPERLYPTCASQALGDCALSAG